MRPDQNQLRPLSGLAQLLGAAPTSGDAPDTVEGESRPVTETTITGITHDSRAVRPGDLYAALPGARAHGAEFAAQAAAAGAVAILTDPAGADRAAATGLPVLAVPAPRARLGEVAAWVYGHPGEDLLLIGTTGTSGKTSVSYLVESGLRAAGLRTGLIGTVEIRIGDERVDSALTTPEATELHGLFAVMRERGVDAAAMEVSSHALALGRVGGARFDVAVFTNLSQDHLDFHADLRDYFDTKARLFTPELARVAVVNRDDRFGRALVDMVAARGEIPVTTFSAEGDPEADWRAVDVELGPEGSVFRVVGPGGLEVDAAVRLPGPFNVSNALAAIVGLVEGGVPLEAALRGVAAAAGVPGRMERVDEGQNFTALVDYSHKPGAVEAVLGSLRTVTEGRLTIVLGCGGDRDRAKRPLMGEVAARLADAVILTDDNPRSEDSITIITSMLDGVAKVPAGERARVTVEPDRAAAIEMAVERAKPGDVVVVAGKGHERGQYVGDRVLPFDDREVLRDALRWRVGG
ncbi:UDP-N-acetylmuramoyl-L-alanyl-D-glutamate--2,6-diaminopimelate ligase [Marinitenerispora sediminis]|uniref:UDP-N-acetylmuramoyl-L-alanyl-D-glutamate--2,6-diaminopimelate ligase n=1 Tax=Marinitenerispora sediminis TaxID=1931232 RepID=A0A368T5I0_9ACTN|nr:UDP-N-acetylmuramoyl-L-alanyl-D-glutamate--2,6-diaminopimelate ligase [Marinitenerispora sediminis]RCV54488.1 UDP-N-acetylmuramoyl-L-alanyl-D-glutamate--2,6-diaminopimelate ligase [Marinitenerispora sediminis]RCV58927.1 UDP-N-acetylmuramoyl-L-alanyl-D-glutamate--2,6-diaminopimelate ligase [Marinitenerispora sediminis]RCV61352.1 UDP-N-acetylmuramoyl-L-alanyl-D-glutamate--2,6-diaminopimelate ligase [Marinitenerispora sediminis]